MARISVLGLGIIGAAWAKNLHADGLDLRTWNRTPKKDFPGFEPDLVRAVEGAETIIIVVADPAAVASILDTIEPHLKPGQLVVQSSTISATWTKKFCARVEARGAIFLEAPFTGSKPAAEARKTVFYLGGTAEAMERAKPVLSRLGEKLVHMGGIGTASTIKLALNLNIAVVAQGLIEALSLVRAQGIPDEKFFAALELNAGRSGISDLKKPKLEQKDYAAQFSLKHIDKDLRLALETAAELELPIAKILKSLYEKGLDAGFGNEDFIGIVRVVGPQK